MALAASTRGALPLHGKGAPPLRKGLLPGSAKSAKSCEPEGPEDLTGASAQSFDRAPGLPRGSNAETTQNEPGAVAR